VYNRDMSNGEVDLVHSERDVLLRYLAKHRRLVVAALDGLTDEQVRRPMVPSGTNLLGLVHHLTGVERHWFELVFLGAAIVPDMSMSAPASTPIDEVIAGYRAACARSDEIVRGCTDLSTLAAIPNPGEDEVDSLRLIIAHMVEETAQHTGQADIIRELIDGRVND
jgi:uncharacterized damage-inducible protein DinB